MVMNTEQALIDACLERWRANESHEKTLPRTGDVVRTKSVRTGADGGACEQGRRAHDGAF